MHLLAPRKMPPPHPPLLRTIDSLSKIKRFIRRRCLGWTAASGCYVSECACEALMMNKGQIKPTFALSRTLFESISSALYIAFDPNTQAIRTDLMSSIRILSWKEAVVPFVSKRGQQGNNKERTSSASTCLCPQINVLDVSLMRKAECQKVCLPCRHHHLHCHHNKKNKPKNPQQSFTLKGRRDFWA